MKTYWSDGTGMVDITHSRSQASKFRSEPTLFTSKAMPSNFKKVYILIEDLVKMQILIQ